MKMNYSEDDTANIVQQYMDNPTRETVDKLAQVYNKSARSIIGKLAKEGVYQRVEYRTKTGEVPVTKLEIVEEIQSQLGCSQTLTGLEKAPKETLKLLLESLD
tara:strand:- start:19 stop:327 length:309 start_codon:yes stop_codon:yes gene_type:complete